MFYDLFVTRIQRTHVQTALKGDGVGDMRTIYVLMVMALATAAIIAGVSPAPANLQADAPAISTDEVVAVSATA